VTDLIIVGVDPGTTVSYSILDLNGKVIEIYSSKELSLNNLIQRVISKGKPFVAGCDVTPAPLFVEKFATKTGAKLIEPDEDLSVSEKEALAKEFNTKNAHEVDSLSSALYAYKIIKPMLEKIKERLGKINKQHLSKEVLELVVKKGLSIADAVKILEEPEKEESKIIKKVVERKILLESDYITLYRKLKDTEKDLKLLKIQNNLLLQKNESLEKKNSILTKKLTSIVPKEKTRELLYFKDKTINAISSEKEEKELEIKLLKNRLLNLTKLVFDLKNKTLLKKLDNLNYEEFKKVSNLVGIKKDDSILVKDLTFYSQKTIDELKNKINLCIYKKGQKSVIEKLPFTCLDAKNLALKEEGNIALVENESLEKELKKQNIVEKVIKEYKAERSI